MLLKFFKMFVKDNCQLKSTLCNTIRWSYDLVSHITQ